MEKRKGKYFGTEIDECWYKRYSQDRFLSRGNGEYWFNEQGFYFLRYLNKEPIFIPYASIVEIKVGTWHSGQWGAGALILKIIWKKDGLYLSSGLGVSRDQEVTLTVKSEFDKIIGKS